MKPLNIVYLKNQLGAIVQEIDTIDEEHAVCWLVKLAYSINKELTTRTIAGLEQERGSQLHVKV